MVNKTVNIQYITLNADYFEPALYL